VHSADPHPLCSGEKGDPPPFSRGGWLHPGYETKQPADPAGRSKC
jgi:hypothetical protein